MKTRLFGILFMTALLVAGFAGPGHATLTYGDLIRVVYGGGYEEATDLGSIASITGSTTTLTLGDGASSSIAGGAAVKLGDFSAYGVTSWSQLTVTYFAVVGTANAQLSTNEVFVSSTAASVANNQNDYTNALWTGAGNVFAYWDGTTSAFKAAGAVGTNSYELVMDGVKVGSLDGWLAGLTGAEATAPSNGSSVLMNLFEWAGSGITYTNGRNTYKGLNVGGQAGTLEGILATTVAGNGLYTKYTPESAVPVPPSALLLLPGLFGLLGLRRKLS